MAEVFVRPKTGWTSATAGSSCQYWLFLLHPFNALPLCHRGYYYKTPGNGELLSFVFITLIKNGKGLRMKENNSS